MTRKLDHKIPGGKLLRVEIELAAGRVEGLRVRGDFFAHPEEAFEAAEAELLGLEAADLARPDFVEAARRAFSRPDLILYGASADDIATTLGRALDAPTPP
jgi:lipoate-protein ligase A